MRDTDSLLTLRDKINAVDEQMVALLAERQALAVEVAQVKRAQQRPVRDVEREHILIERIMQLGQQHQLNSSTLLQIFQLIIEDSVLTQQALLQASLNGVLARCVGVAFLGPRGSYSHLAACNYASRHFEKYHELGCLSFQDVITQVESSQADYGVLPVENTSSGVINAVYDLLQHTKLRIVGEIHVPIEHCVLVAADTTLEQINVVYSHPQPFEQCNNFICRFPHWEKRYVQSTAAAMEKVAALNSPEVAALGSCQGGALYQLKVLKRVVSNQVANITRFIILAREQIAVAHPVPAKTTLIMSTEQHAGALASALLIFQKHQLILNKLTSRPQPGNPWEELFYVDFQGNLRDANVQLALKELTAITRSVKIIGCYPNERVIHAEDKSGI